MDTNASRPARAAAGSGQWLQVSLTIAFAAVLTVLLVLGMRAAGRLQAASSALQLASQLSERPQGITAELTLVQRGLETTTYVGGPVRTLAAMRDDTSRTLTAIQGQLHAAGLDADAGVTGALRSVLRRWQPLERRLQRVQVPSGRELYVDTPAGSALSGAGKRLKSTVDGLLTTQQQTLASLSADVSGLAGVLRASVDGDGLALRALLLAGSAVALLLLGLVLFYGWRSRSSARAAAGAQRQVSDILATVREGLFLIDRDMRLSATYSQSLRELLRLPSPAGLRMEEVLKPLVEPKTLTAALKFLGLLWKDKVHEELIESVNPLSQIEVSFDEAHTDVRYLAFSFRRVRAAEGGDYILGVVTDVTDRVLLSRELDHLKAENDSQAALQLQLLRVEPEPMGSFLSSADTAFRKSNAALNSPGIEQEDLKRKLNSVFRELHAVKGEAAALGLQSFVQRLHTVEDALAGLRQRPALSGNDFLPVVVKLDELIGYLAQIRSMYERVTALRPATAHSQPPRPRQSDAHRDTTVIGQEQQPPPAAVMARATALAEMLRTLTAETARAQGRTARLLTHGLEEVPPPYATVVKDICIQMIRNSVAHGIEPPAERARLGKPEAGTVQIGFRTDGEDYALTIEDDGRGLSYERIVDKALRLDMISPQQAVSLDRSAVYRMIFQPGFSTSEEVSEHAGRGVGLDAVSSLVRSQGGRIGVATSSGKYTRFRVLLPRPGSASLAASTAA